MLGKKQVIVELSPYQTRRLKEPFNIILPASDDGFVTLTLKELETFRDDIVGAIKKYQEVMEGKHKK